MIERLLSGAHRLSTWLVWLAGILLVGSALLVTLEVILRKVANISLGGADEISGYAFGIATALAMAYALFERAHIRVDAAYLFFPRWLRRIADLAGLILLIGFAAVIAFTGWDLLSDSIEYGSRSITPMRTPRVGVQTPWMIGWVFFVLCGLLLLAASVVYLVTGRAAKTDALLAAKSVQEQINDEI